ncbi:hypothetical protein MAPG_03144 [Magnaporthiopsis poae ATCC 64411]|uniref:Uncharacterized protein n=1 Tax=Magnaporthiopsis poae (strain ATCC 64411 / 73-15) TaxID=644358 RepID=A0A0C4DT84_MAGP6|nr:hypothetical protein MAPG_03144 [Magnaporthiopsis poae ATCC 64411]
MVSLPNRPANQTIHPKWQRQIRMRSTGRREKPRPLRVVCSQALSAGRRMAEPAKNAGCRTSKILRSSISYHTGSTQAQQTEQILTACKGVIRPSSRKSELRHPSI